MQNLYDQHSRWHQRKAIDPIKRYGILATETQESAGRLYLQKLERQSPHRPTTNEGQEVIPHIRHLYRLNQQIAEDDKQNRDYAKISIAAQYIPIDILHHITCEEKH